MSFMENSNHSVFHQVKHIT